MYKWMLCFRYLTTRYIALASIVSVMLGVATMIVVNGIMGGFRDKMRERLHGVLADVVVESTTMDGFPQPERVMQLVRQLCGDRVESMTPAIEVFAMLHYQNQGRGRHFTRPVRLVGIDAKGRTSVGEFNNYLRHPENRADPSFALRSDGEAWRKQNIDAVDAESGVPTGAIIGYQIATFRVPGMESDQFLIEPGQEIILTTVNVGRPPKPVDDRFVVVDTYKCDMSEYDGNYVYVPIERLQRMRGMGDAVTSIQIKLRHWDDAPFVVEALRSALPRVHYTVETWEDKQGALLHAVKIEAFLLNIILFFIIAVAGFGILATFFMIVVEKTRDIGIMKALGASSSGVMGLFLSYGLALGMVGCGLGALFGISFTTYINQIEQALSSWFGYQFFPRDVYYFKEIPTRLDPLTVIVNILGALLIATAASVLPARRAARLRPVEALRYE